MIGKRSRDTEQLLIQMERQLDRIHTTLVVRDPGTSLSVDAYEGLRKQVIASASARLQHVAQLAEFDVALRRGASTQDLLILVDQWFRQAGVERVEDTTVRDAWEVAPSPGVEATVDTPAYVDGVTNRLIRQGRLKPKSRSEGKTEEVEVDAEANAESIDPVGSVSHESNSIKRPDPTKTDDNADLARVDTGDQVDESTRKS